VASKKNASYFVTQDPSVLCAERAANHGVQHWSSNPDIFVARADDVGMSAMHSIVAEYIIQNAAIFFVSRNFVELELKRNNNQSATARQKDNPSPEADALHRSQSRRGG
jgi:hypothetical protein